MSESILNQAIALAKAGRKIEARNLLGPLLESDRHNIAAWFWYADTWPDDQQKIKALELCSKHNPDSQTIQQALEVLRSRQETPNAQPPLISSLPETTAAQQKTEATKKCRYCAETIKAEAVVCRFCGRDLGTGQLLSTTPAFPEQQSPLLNSRIESLVTASWQLVNRTTATAQLKKPKQWNGGCLGFCVLFLLGGIFFAPLLGLAIIGLLLAVADYALKKDELVYLTEEQLQQEKLYKAEEQREREEAAARDEQARLERQRKHEEERKLREQRKHSTRGKNGIQLLLGLPQKQFWIIAGTSAIGFIIVVVVIVAVLIALSQSGATIPFLDPTVTNVPTSNSPTLLNSLTDFENSQFCQTYKCTADESWGLRSGGTNHTYITDISPDVSVEIVTLNAKPSHFGLTFYDRNRLDADDLQYVYSFLEAVHPGTPIDDTIKNYIQQNTENDVPQICEASPIQFGLLKIWSGKIFQQTISVDENCLN